MVGRSAPFYFYRGIGAVRVERVGEALAAMRGTIRKIRNGEVFRFEQIFLRVKKCIIIDILYKFIFGNFGYFLSITICYTEKYL